jgi:hypothetical protein
MARGREAKTVLVRDSHLAAVQARHGRRFLRTLLALDVMHDALVCCSIRARSRSLSMLRDDPASLDASVARLSGETERLSREPSQPPKMYR